MYLEHVRFLSEFLFFSFIIIVIILLYSIVLVLPYINMHPPWNSINMHQLEFHHLH